MKLLEQLQCIQTNFGFIFYIARKNQEKNREERVVMFLLSFVHYDDSTNVEKEKCIP